jgi:hypothetical protein
MNMRYVGAALIALWAAGSGLAQEKAPEKAQEPKKSWTDSLKFGGDVRARYQSTAEEAKDTRERGRFRARLTLDGKVNDEVSAGLRLVTNVGNPITDVVDMGSSFDDKVARFDRVFLRWVPVEDLALTFGKMAQPWISVADLVYSVDMNPEGAAANYALKGDAFDLLFNGGAFLPQERSSDEETMLFSGQAAVRIPTGGKDYVVAGGSLFLYDGLKGYAPLYDPTKSFGNTTVTTTTMVDGEPVETLQYATDFTVVEGFVEAGFDVGCPLVVGAQYAVNTDADAYDTAYLATAQLGKVADKGSWAVGYQYRYLEKDAVLGVFAESTDFGSGTNVKGHIPFVQYGIGKNFDVKMQYAMGQKGLENGKDIETFKIDLNAKF